MTLSYRFIRLELCTGAPENQASTGSFGVPGSLGLLSVPQIKQCHTVADSTSLTVSSAWGVFLLRLALLIVWPYFSFEGLTVDSERNSFRFVCFNLIRCPCR